MIASQTTKIINAALERFSASGDPSLPKGVRVSLDRQESRIVYDLLEAERFSFTAAQAGTRITFLQILNQKIDILNFGRVASDFMKKSLSTFALGIGPDATSDQVSAVIYRFDGALHMKIFHHEKEIITLPLALHFARMGVN